MYMTGICLKCSASGGLEKMLARMRNHIDVLIDMEYDIEQRIKQEKPDTTQSTAVSAASNFSEGKPR